jgi:1-acyl-sn-glycerol-3-phosphate acyltransferase
LGLFGIIISIFESKKGKFLGKCARIWAKVILFNGGVKYTVKNLDNLNLSNSYIFAGNHSSGFDILLGFAGLPFWIVSIAKIELRSVFVLGFVMRVAGHIFVDRKNHESAMSSLKKASVSLKKNPRSILLYPEGTRTKDGSIQNFKPGGLLLAVETGMPIVPIYYSGTYSILNRGSWKLNNQNLKLIIGKPIFTEKYSFETRRELAKKVQFEVVKLSNTFKE